MTARKSSELDDDQQWFLYWLGIVDRDKRDLSDQAIARAFGVHHRLIASARAGVAWQSTTASTALGYICGMRARFGSAGWWMR